MKQITTHALRRRGFIVIGYWEYRDLAAQSGSIRLRRVADTLRRESVPAVYTHDIEGHIFYVGGTGNFRMRMREYGPTCRLDREGLIELHRAVAQGRSVRTMALLAPDPIRLIGLTISPVLSIEEALRHAIQPVWNRAGMKSRAA